MACWARLREPEKAMANFRHALRTYTLPNLFSTCAKALQVDGSLGLTAALAEMLLQSQEYELLLMPTLPSSWPRARSAGCGHAAGSRWISSGPDGRLETARVHSVAGKFCRIRTDFPAEVISGGVKVKFYRPEEGIVEFRTQAGRRLYRPARAAAVEPVTGVAVQRQALGRRNLLPVDVQ